MQDIFHPLGSTYVVPAAATAPAGIQVPPSDQNAKYDADHYRVVNTGSEIVYMGYGKDATEATANSVAPVSGTEQKCIVIQPNSIEIIKLGADVWLSGKAAAGNDLFVTVGKGL